MQSSNWQKGPFSSCPSYVILLTGIALLHVEQNITSRPLRYEQAIILYEVLTSLHPNIRTSIRLAVFPHRSRVTDTPCYGIIGRKRPHKNNSLRKKFNVFRKIKLYQWNLQNIIPRDTAMHSENFVNIINRKQKLHLFEVKTAILLLNDLYFSNCCKKMSMKLSVWFRLRRGESKVRREVLIQQNTVQPG